RATHTVPARRRKTGDPRMDRAARYDAAAEAADRPEMVELLTGKYGMDAATAEDILATVRRQGSEVVTVARRAALDGRLEEGWRFRVGIDAGGYTIEELAHEGGQS